MTFIVHSFSMLTDTKINNFSFSYNISEAHRMVHESIRNDYFAVWRKILNFAE